METEKDRMIKYGAHIVWDLFYLSVQCHKYYKNGTGKHFKEQDPL